MSVSGHFATGSSQQQVGQCPLCPDSDQILHLAEMTRRANRDTLRCSEQRHHAITRVGYSITSSAVASSEGGTLRPSAFAVLRLMVNWTLTGSWTGSSLGFVPRKMRSA
jgi:hypothetical protein